MFDSCTLQAGNDEQMRKIGTSLAQTVYRTPGTIVLRGELGAGKTTFVQGFAKGLGINDGVTSPTYALEQRYGDDVLSHIDLYRLSSVQAAEFMRTLDPFAGIRMIEWSDRTQGIETDIEVEISEAKEGRRILITFSDIALPSDAEIETWMEEVMLPEHIQRHVRKVADICDTVADHLLAQGRPVRKKALRAAALTHDLLRFVDFKSLTGDDVFTPSAKQTKIWAKNKETYDTPHEAAAEKFLVEHGFTDIGRIVRTHRGHGTNSMPETIEQYALAYADKRAVIDKPVTLDQRFDDFIVRYGKGKESDTAKEWRTEMKRIETFLFPDGAPF